MVVKILAPDLHFFPGGCTQKRRSSKLRSKTFALSRMIFSGQNLGRDPGKLLTGRLLHMNLPYGGITWNNHPEPAMTQGRITTIFFDRTRPRLCLFKNLLLCSIVVRCGLFNSSLEVSGKIHSIQVDSDFPDWFMIVFVFRFIGF